MFYALDKNLHIVSRKNKNLSISFARGHETGAAARSSGRSAGEHIQHRFATQIVNACVIRVSFLDSKIMIFGVNEIFLSSNSSEECAAVCFSCSQCLANAS
jgi:hypothetical protein